MRSKSLIIILLLSTAIFISGCSIKLSGSQSNQSATDGGIWRSANKGQVWVQKTLIPSASGRPTNFGAFDSYVLAMDPQDRRALYLGTINEGLLFTYDGGENWQRVPGLGRSIIRALAIDPADKCTIYAAIDNKLYKSVDCSRSWTQAYFDNDLNLKVTAVAVNGKDPRIVLIGTTRGDIIRSLDGGTSWQTIERFSSKVLKILPSPYDSKIVFAATERNSLERSNDGGATWTALEKNLKDFKDSINFKDLVFSGKTAGKIFLASKIGLYVSEDNGDSWDKINLITPETKTGINALAVSPKDDKEMYYVTNTTFYKSVDGGANWTPKKLPTSRAGWVLLIDPEDTNIIYLAVRTAQ